jgi:hypothetical protein
MGIVQNTGGSLILNETTMTLHKQELGLGEFQTVCGHADHVGQEKLRIIGVPDRIKQDNTSKCGQCFEGRRGY